MTKCASFWPDQKEVKIFDRDGSILACVKTWTMKVFAQFAH